MRHPLAICLTISLISAMQPGSARGQDGGEEWRVLRSDRVDGTHRQLAPEITPIDLAGLIITLSSTSHNLDVHSHALELRPDGNNSHEARVRADFEGEADLVATLEVAGLGGDLEDHVTVPRQQLELQGRLEIHQESDGYRVTVLEAPAEMEIRVDSQLGVQLVALCQGLTMFALGDTDCTLLQSALSKMKLPLPEPGKTYWIPVDKLTNTEREQIEAYLAGTEATKR